MIVASQKTQHSASRRKVTRPPGGLARVRGQVVQTTAAGVLIYDHSTRRRIWLPKSEIAGIRRDTTTDIAAAIEACVPAWLPHRQSYPYEL